MIDTVYILLALVLLYVGLQVLRDNNQLSSQSFNRLVGSALLIAATAVLIWLYGLLAGIFIGIAAISLMGMLVPLISQRT